MTDLKAEPIALPEGSAVAAPSVSGARPSTAILARLVAQFEPDRLRIVEVPEWAAPAEVGEPVPFKIWHRPVSFDDISRMHARKDGWRDTMFDRSLWLVMNKAADEAGQLIFNPDRTTDEGKADFETLAHKVDPFIITRIAAAMIGG